MIPLARPEFLSTWRKSRNVVPLPSASPSIGKSSPPVLQLLQHPSAGECCERRVKQPQVHPERVPARVKVIGNIFRGNEAPVNVGYPTPRIPETHECSEKASQHATSVGRCAEAPREFAPGCVMHTRRQLSVVSESRYHRNTIISLCH